MIWGGRIVILSEDLGSIFMICGALKTALKFVAFLWPPECVPKIRVGRTWVLITALLGPSKPVREHCSRQHVETGLQQTAWRIQGYTNVQYPRSLVPL